MNTRLLIFLPVYYSIECSNTLEEINRICYSNECHNKYCVCAIVDYIGVRPRALRKGTFTNIRAVPSRVSVNVEGARM